ncbi:GNAT superfamily N-acetyltransferase [Catenuloplanes nepalensis]|uniref:GNAT superfamily N-acetyltransferase n=1 Tax=Catenuloplanes nepalensis TaxID=587533 RepID=A0ABT9MMB8_9ACTN|nr:GNAT family N-acetyltransferase [Catenuloplanes nepalensis]MDP9792529.1 GNAT superfamily N-acetyltransferase [Catenuloplanes nepalensis]
MHETLVPIYASSHAELLHEPWYSPDDWWMRLVQRYAITSDFGLVTGWINNEAIGYAFGSLDSSARHKDAVTLALPQISIYGSLYIFREFAVTPPWQGHGFGRQIHNALLSNRPEKAAHLLLRKDNHSARAAYTNWGWVSAGEFQPFPESPTFDAMALDLSAFRSTL